MRSVFLILFLFPVILFSQKQKKITGKWQGTYTCRQGVTGLTLLIKSQTKGKIKGMFVFYPTPENPYPKHGKFSFTGTISENGNITFIHNKWHKKPKDYKMIDLVGSVNGNQIVGRSTTTGCDQFEVYRKSSKKNTRGYGTTIKYGNKEKKK